MFAKNKTLREFLLKDRKLSPGTSCIPKKPNGYFSSARTFHIDPIWYIIATVQNENCCPLPFIFFSLAREARNMFFMCVSSGVSWPYKERLFLWPSILAKGTQVWQPLKEIMPRLAPRINVRFLIPRWRQPPPPPSCPRGSMMSFFIRIFFISFLRLSTIGRVVAIGYQPPYKENNFSFSNLRNLVTTRTEKNISGSVLKISFSSFNKNTIFWISLAKSSNVFMAFHTGTNFPNNRNRKTKFRLRIRSYFKPLENGWEKRWILKGMFYSTVTVKRR